MPLKEFSPDEAIDLWWSDRVRRPNQKPRNPYRKRKHTRKVQEKVAASIITSTSDYVEILSSESEVEIRSEIESDSDESFNMLGEWDNWMGFDDEADDS